VDSIIEKLQKKGYITVWRYTENTRNFPGWNISFDELGFQFIKDLLDLMNNSQWSSKKDIGIDLPTKKILDGVNNLKGKASWKSIKKLSLQFKKNYSEDSIWEISLNNNLLIVTFNSLKLQELKESIIRVNNGSGDFAIADSESNNILYFWSF
jgi:hypothetical protein